jgi:guanylate kinase
MEKSNIFIISGPSGAGEDSIMNGLKKYFDVERIVNTTTRKMRPGESDGNPYYFISQEDFQDGIKNDQFAEYAREYNANYYGVTNKELDRVCNSGKIGLWKMEYKGVMTVKNKYPEIPSIFINVPSLEILERRIRRRDNVSEEYVKERMEYTKEWLKHIDIYDHIVVNEEGQLEKSINEVAEIIKKHTMSF